MKKRYLQVDGDRRKEGRKERRKNSSEERRDPFVDAANERTKEGGALSRWNERT